MDLEKAVQFLVEHMAVLDAKLETMATKQDLEEVKAALRNGQRFVTQYMAKTDTLTAMLTESQLRLEETADRHQNLLDRLQARIEALEKRNPPQQAA
jgi:hypothetical protein